MVSRILKLVDKKCQFEITVLKTDVCNVSEGIKNNV